MQKIRIEFNATKGPNTKRELLLGFSDQTTDDYDYGFEAKNTDIRQGFPYKFSSEQGVFNKRFQIVFQNESKTLSTEVSAINENHMYYQNRTHTFFAKKLNSNVSKFSLLNMRGQAVLELND